MTQIPVFLLSATIIFWGWRTGLWMAAVPMAIGLEASRFVQFKWEFSFSDFSRISDFCALLVAILVLHLYLSRRAIYIIFELIQWLPVAFFPLVLAQDFSTAGKIDLRAISLFFRRRRKTGNPITLSELNLDYPYMALCILSASFAAPRDNGFYLGLMILVAWALWPVRRKGSSPVLWSVLLVVVFHGGYAGHIGLHRLQEYIEKRGMEWFFDLKRKVDPYRSITALGYIGQLKPSNRILFRAIPDPGLPGPFLLREASYNHFLKTKWYAHRSEFLPVPPGRSPESWRWGDSGPDTPKIRIMETLEDNQGMLKLPTGACRIDNLPVLEIDRNSFGAVRIGAEPGWIDYTVRFGNATPLDSRPEAKDLAIPDTEVETISEIHREAGLTGLPPGAVPVRLEQFFQQHFAYTLDLDSRRGQSPLSDFLKRSRAGHCEYFATAAVFLLRSAGIPARYAIGFSVFEESPYGSWLIARSRHAHAWALAYIDGRWRDVDVTPSTWATLEAEAAPFWQPVTDLWSWLVFRFSRWRLREGTGNPLRHLVWISVPLIVWMALRRFRKTRIRRAKDHLQDTAAPARFGGDSPFYRIEKRLSRLGWTRAPGEPVRAWLGRIDRGAPNGVSVEPLFGILILHYRYRFDPEGLTENQKADLHAFTEQWLAMHPNG